ncbi:MAG: hypothetical protein NC489_31825 [Ruminococcus flavefaciens]|nr:hypothetical protein [Ruminococcus flavefaciens]
MAKMAVTVLLVVLIIGAVVAIVYKAYSWFNSGADKLGDQVNSIDSSSYSTYDDSQVTGTDVLTALKSYRDSNIAIIIVNSQNGGYADAASSAQGYNYCGLVKGSTADNPVTINYDSTAGQWSVPEMEWDNATGLVVRNTNFSPTTSKNKKDQFVKQGGQFYSNLIWDQSTGEVCGILFRQMGS